MILAFIVLIIPSLVNGGLNGWLQSQADDWLRLALLAGQYKRAEILIKMGADINSRGNTPLPLVNILAGSCTEGNQPRVSDIRQLSDPDMVRLDTMVRKFGADLTVTDSDGRTALHFAVAMNCLGNAQILLENYKNDEQLRRYVDKTDRLGRTPLHYAASANENFEHAFRCFATTDFAPMTEMLLDAGAWLEVTDRHVMTPLHWAARCNSPQVLKILLDKGAKVNVLDRYGQLPIHWALSCRSIMKIKYLMDAGSEMWRPDADKSTPLFRLTAIQGTPKELIEMVFNDPKVDVNAEDESGRTALFNAVRSNDEELVRMLVERGAQVDVTDHDGKTPLYLAFDMNRVKMVEVLLELGADPNKKYAKGMTLLHMNGSWTSPEIYRLLIEEGKADTTIRDDEGKTAFDRSEETSNFDIRRMLLVNKT